MGKKELIVSFIHSDYKVKTAGTEKFVLELSKELQQQGFAHLCIFPIQKKYGLHKEQLTGAYYNDHFLGIFEYSQIKALINDTLYIYNLKLNCIHLEHLMYNNLALISDIIHSYAAETIVFLHDFYLICSSPHLINTEGVFCGENGVSSKKCSRCGYYSKAKDHKENIQKFIIENKDYIRKYIAPSEYVKKVVIHSFPVLTGKIIVRPLLKMCDYVPISFNSKDAISIAFVGQQKAQKGYDSWKKIVDFINTNKLNIRMYYLGIGKERLENVSNIYVSTLEQGKDAMKKALRRNNIDCAFLWPACPETYSYVYFELASAGVFILTNSISGNISIEVQKRNNGIVFDGLDNCVKWLDNPVVSRKSIEKYKEKAMLFNTEANNDLKDLISIHPSELKIEGLKHAKRDPILAIMYKLKYRFVKK